jgi:hypothetical protein
MITGKFDLKPFWRVLDEFQNEIQGNIILASLEQRMNTRFCGWKSGKAHSFDQIFNFGDFRSLVLRI